MFLIFVLVGALIGVLAWNYLVNSKAVLDVKIPTSKNISYSEEPPIPLTVNQIEDQISQTGAPILLYVYTTWCGICEKNFATINQIADEFQNTELNFMAVAIDDHLEGLVFQKYLGKFGKIYFKPYYLVFNKESFLKLIKQKGYNGRIPFLMLIARDGKTLLNVSGIKSKSYLRNKIISSLFAS